MKKLNSLWFVLLAIFALGCSPDEDNDNDLIYPILPPAVLAEINTSPIMAITQASATGGGTISSDHNTPVTERGICWATTDLPTIANDHTTDGPGTGNFTSTMTGLTANTVYFVRAYATNAAGTAYGAQMMFTTAETAALPVVNTISVSGITSTTFTCDSEITSDGGAPVTERGVAYGTSPEPTIAGTRTTDGTGTGVFTSAATGLTPGTAYYARVYATNSVGTSYGEEISFITP